MKEYKKIGRLMSLDLRRSTGSKVLLALEMVVCVLLLAVAFSGLSGARHMQKLYSNLDGVYVQIFRLDSEEQEQQIVDKIFAENQVGRIDLVDMIFRGDMKLFGYNDVMLSKVPIKLSQGSLFSDSANTEEYRELILDNSFSKKFKVGQVITNADLGLNQECNYKIIGFLQNNYGVLDHQYNCATKGFGIVKTDQVIGLNDAIIFTDSSMQEFKQRYGIAQFEGVGSNSINFYTVQELYSMWTADGEQIMSFFQMFMLIAVCVYFSTIISAIVVKHNDNLIFNKNMLKIGTTRQEFLWVKLANVLAISVFCMLVSLILLLTIVAPNVSLIAKYATLSAGIIAGSMAIIILSYAAIEIAEVFVMYNKICKEKK